jgi:segregation and condensation protein B
MSDQEEIKTETPTDAEATALDATNAQGEIAGLQNQAAKLAEEKSQLEHLEALTSAIAENAEVQLAVDPALVELEAAAPDVEPGSDEAPPQGAPLEASGKTSGKKQKAGDDEPFVMDTDSFTSAVEAVLFAAERPASFDRIREAFGTPSPNDDQLKEAIDRIQARYEGPDRGFLLRKAQGGYHFVTKVENAEYIRRFQASKPFRLGRSALEVLAIIAYRAPVTRAEIDQVRGIDSSHLLRTLIERGLVRMAGKAEVPGRPVQYATTQKFLEVVGLAATSDLPPLSELNQLQGDAEDPQRKMEEGLDRFMRPVDRTAAEEASMAPLEDEDGQDPMLNEIDSLIQTAGNTTKEVYASPVHRDVAEANQEALEAFQAMSRRRPRKKAEAVEEAKSITFDELTGGGADGSNAPPAPVEN